MKAYGLLDQIMVVWGHLTRLDLMVATPNSLPMMVAAFDASVPDFIA